ncbi:hypothetical protein C0Z11_01845 [Acidipropionibacterium jensenii]|uniref:hypothetical protein n=1 Tax=Acidipropionibacterium jensenii TaxID=1749 RepID=UPI000BC31458|nr:hypothetical protein [Acidipropionibacterium jensenii]AZZ41238.1 hypothetical protein C0Z11_01845 [Acidipropionibacterium jensenii]
MTALDWVAKPFGPGDIAGDGTKKLLGTSVAPATLLLRETAQNSWDARRSGRVPEYQMRFRTLDERGMRVLRKEVFPGTPPHPGEGIIKSLRVPSMNVIEIHDRGTAGLGGPTRNDSMALAGATTNYRDFVLTVGAPRDQQYGGGTYGFGKTSAFRASRCETILVWTRIEPKSGQFEERLIAIAVNKSFVWGGVRYTGQQWWGRRAEIHGMPQVEPVLDDEAHRLGESLFERGFSPTETGTSIMILAPAFVDGRDQFVQEVQRAITLNLWPKIIEGQPDDRRMDISLVVDGRSQRILNAADSAVIAAKQQCLSVVRQLQDGQESTNPLVEDFEIRCGNPKRRIGRLALRACVSPPGDPFKDAENAVTLMRSGAELVVEDKDFGKIENGRGEWVGVFKPELEMDDVFAAAEPPSHDEWNLSALQGHSKTFVNVGLRRIKETVKSFLAPLPDPEQVKDESSAGELAQALGALVVPALDQDSAAQGSGTKRSKSSKRRDARRRTSKVEILGYKLVPSGPTASRGTAMTQFTLRALSDSKHGNVQVTPKFAIAGEGDQKIDDDEVYVDSWVTRDGVDRNQEGLVVPSGAKFTANVSYPSDVAIECGFDGKDV